MLENKLVKEFKKELFTSIVKKDLKKPIHPVQYKTIITFYFKLIKGWDRIWVAGVDWKPEGREPNQKEMWIIIFLFA